jgi:hypothetical protein
VRQAPTSDTRRAISGFSWPAGRMRIARSRDAQFVTFLWKTLATVV